MLKKKIPFRDLMISLFYPAVLGSIFVKLFELLPKISSLTSFVTDNKTIFLFIAILFYCSDYLYAKYSNDYGLKFFFFDFLFLACMLYGVDALKLSDMNSDIEFVSLALSYFVFTLGYLIWDYIEFVKVEGEEKRYYARVITWELLFLTCLLVVTVMGYFFNEHFETKTLLNILLVILVLSTIWFAYLALEKKEYFIKKE